jgi:hypothetical protein
VTRDEYLRSVSFELGDLPWSMRQDLLAELRGHLEELPAGTNLDERLGPAEDYAADLRAAAGLERRHGAKAFLMARRPRTLVLAALALTVIGLAIGAVIWVQSYQPLSRLDNSIVPNGAKNTPTDNGDSVTFHKGRPFQVGVFVKNTGPFTVHVVGAAEPHALPLSPAGIPSYTSLPVSARLLVSRPLPPHKVIGPFTPFQPFYFHPGQVRLILLKGVYGNCKEWAPGSIGGIDSIPVRFSYLWKTTTVHVPLINRLAIVMPKRGCS